MNLIENMRLDYYALYRNINDNCLVSKMLTYTLDPLV